MAPDQDSPELGAAVRALVAPVAATEAGPVLLCLQKVQEHFGYVPDGAVAVIADVCNITRADVHGVFSYYSDLKQAPGPAVPVRICAAEACQAMGARALAKAEEYQRALTAIDKVFTCEIPSDYSVEHKDWLIQAQELKSEIAIKVDDSVPATALEPR